jgi:transposase
MEDERRIDIQKRYMRLVKEGLPGNPVMVYEYHPTRSSIHEKTFFQDFSGYVQTDGYTGCDATLEGWNDIVHVECFAHAQRKFFEAAKISKKADPAEVRKEIYLQAVPT